MDVYSSGDMKMQKCEVTISHYSPLLTPVPI